MVEGRLDERVARSLCKSSCEPRPSPLPPSVGSASSTQFFGPIGVTVMKGENGTQGKKGPKGIFEFKYTYIDIYIYIFNI